MNKSYSPSCKGGEHFYFFYLKKRKKIFSKNHTDPSCILFSSDCVGVEIIGTKHPCLTHKFPYDPRMKYYKYIYIKTVWYTSINPELNIYDRKYDYKSKY